MSGFATNTTDHLIRSNLWTTDLKDVLEGELLGLGFVKMLTEFPDGDTLNIPSIGQAEVLDYVEGQAIRYTAMDTGNFTFTIDQYKSSATYITNKMKQDSYVMNQLVSAFVPKQSRALMVAMENLLMSIGPDAQTVSSLNQINGASHRFVGSGTSGKIALADFARAKYALDKAFVPSTNRIAIVDPSVEHELNTLTNLVSVQNNAMWEGIITSGLSTGMRFIRNIYGFDVYVSNYLKGGYTETINAVSVTNGVANVFFSAAPDVLPFVGHIRQSPKVDSEYNKDLQRDEYVTTCRYGFKLFRPENMVVILTGVVSI
jgi:hypothetical protein